MTNRQLQPTKHQLINLDPLELKRQTALLFFLLGPFTILYVLENVLSVWNLTYVHYFFVQSFVLVISHLFNLNVGPKQRIIQVEEEKFESTTVIEDITEQEQAKATKTITNSTETHRYSESLELMFQQFEKIISNGIENSPGKWNIMVNQPESQLKVFRDTSKDYRYACETYLDNSPATVIDTVLNPRERDASSSKLADKYIANFDILEQLGPTTNINVLETKGIWPTAGRIASFIQSTRVLPNNSVIVVFKSVDVDNKPPPKDSKAVNLDIFLSGMMLLPVEGQPKKCKFISIIDTDPHGWIPQSLISLISSQIVPYVIKKINTKVLSKPVRTVPTLLDPSTNGQILQVSTSNQLPTTSQEEVPPSPTSSTGTLVSESISSKVTLHERPKYVQPRSNTSFFNSLLDIKNLTNFFFNRFTLGTGSTIIVVGVIMTFLFRRNK